MTSSSLSNYNDQAFPDDSEFLDSAPLHLSGGSAGLDVFDFILDDEDDELNDGGEIDVGGADDAVDRLFADSRGSADLDALLDSADEDGADMDFEFDTLKSSLREIGFDAIDEGDETMRSSGNSNSLSYRPQSSRRRNHSQSSFQMSAVNFDPPAAPQQQQRNSFSLTRSMPPQRIGGAISGDYGPPRRLTSESDLSMCSYSTAQSSPLPNPLPPAFRRASEGVVPVPAETSYNEALSNLAESMKRTEATRRHVMMQKNMLTPAQQMALASAKEQLQAHNQQLQQQQQRSVTPPSQDLHIQEVEESSQRSSIVAAFFSGSRGTLTNGLEQSRRQLSMYMGQVNHQTL